MKTIIGLYDDIQDAREASEDLAERGFIMEDMSLMARATADEMRLYMGDEEEDRGFGDAVKDLLGMGATDREAQTYTEAVRRGGTLLMVDAPEDKIDQVVDIMEEHDPVDIEKRAQEWHREERDVETAEREFETDEDRVLPLAEEEVRIGKRTISTGGIRVHTRVVEEPVEEEVRLREERVEVERRDVDQPISEAEADEVFEEGTLEARATTEEVVTDKQARITGEVGLDKEVDQHTETVRDTVRHMEVDIEEIEPEIRAGYERHYEETYRDRGAYETYEPAYAYGHQLADRLDGSNRWEDVQPRARREWEMSHDDTAWEDVKEAVREGWESAT